METLELMAAFFDERAKGYDAYIRGYIFTEEEFSGFYQAISLPIEKTDAPINIFYVLTT